MRFFQLTLSSLFLLLAACGDNKDKAATGNNIDINKAIEQAESRRSSDLAASGGNTCLLAYQEKYDALLSEELVIRETGFDSKNLTTKYTKVMKPEHHSFDYKFKNKRLGKVMGFDREMELTDIVSVHSIKAMSLDQFTKSYKAVSAAEMQAAKDAVNDLSVDKPDEQKETIRKGSNKMLDTFKEVSEGYEPIDGIGDKATWNKVTNDLAVLTNGVKFEIKAAISNDPEKNKAVAMLLAKAVLTKCP